MQRLQLPASHYPINANMIEPLDAISIHVWTFDKKTTLCPKQEILSLYTNIPISELEFIKNDNGKPFLKNTQLEFNLSHSKTHGVLALSKAPIGIDTEFRKNINFLAIAKRFFAPSEYKTLLSQTTPEKKRHSFYTFWTKKEAFCKALGDKLVHHLHTDTQNLSEWHFETLPLKHRYQTTLAYKNKDKKTIKIFDYNSFLKR